MISVSDAIDILYLKIAGAIIGIRFQKIQEPYLIEKSFRNRVFQNFTGFVVLTPSKVDYWIEIVHQTNLEALTQTNSKNHFINIYQQKGLNQFITFYHTSDIHFQLLIRDICQDFLSKNKGFIFHGSASNISKKAFVFLGKSGAGKSTAMSLLTLKFPALADDSLIIKQEGKSLFFYQTPFQEKNWWISKDSKRYELGKFFFLKKSSFNKVEKIREISQISNLFIEQLLTEAKDSKKQITQILNILSSFKEFYILSFNLQQPEEMVKLVSKI